MSLSDVLVTGSTGLIGREVMQRLGALGAEATGVSRRPSLGTVATDLTDTVATEALIRCLEPSAVVHLAGAVVGSPDQLRRANVETTRNVLDSVARSSPPTAVIVVGSAAEFGAPQTELVSEDHPLRPLSDYGRAKAEQTSLAQALAERHGLRLLVLRPFNIISRGLPRTSALGNMREQLLGQSGSTRQVSCGRLDVVRDFVPLELVAEAVTALLLRDDWPATLNVCSGVGLRLADVLTSMASQLQVELEVVAHQELSTIPAPDRIVGDATLLRSYGLVSSPTLDSVAREMTAPPSQSRPI